MVDVRELAKGWLEVEPDSDIRDELALLLDGRDEDLRAAFAGSLTFGTAGLRAAIGAGPLRMNRLVVRQAAAGLVDHLVRTIPGSAERGILIGYDARHKSHDFAVDTARVAAARGVRSWIFCSVVPTPVLAWNVPRLGVAGGVMVTASHNPARDNGYKVYLASGAQIVPPVDVEIARAIAKVDPLTVEVSSIESPLITWLDDDAVEQYLAWIPSVRVSPQTSRVSLAYTPLHGVGGRIALQCFQRAGFDAPVVVDEQMDPDPDFPTVEFPNPEEDGAMDRVIAAARVSGTDLALAHDPDGDRLGVAIPTRAGDWRLLKGDEIGWLFADHILRHTRGADRLVVTTLVSSSLLGEMAAVHGVEFAETYTGFKWIADAVIKRPTKRLVFAYEQALGYLVASSPLDKDGLSAGVLMAEIAALAVSEGKTVEDRLLDIAHEYGDHRTAEVSVRMEPAEAHQVMERVRAHPPATLGGRKVIEVVDHPEASLIRLWVQGHDSQPIRVQIRPSGTEPKVKIYGEAVGEDPNPYLQDLVTILTHRR